MEKLFNGMTYPEAHKALWTWLSENPKKSKYLWFRERTGGKKDSGIRRDCFACETVPIDEY